MVAFLWTYISQKCRPHEQKKKPTIAIAPENLSIFDWGHCQGQGCISARQLPRRVAQNSLRRNRPCTPRHRSTKKHHTTMPRTRPNIIITGTPGVGKSSHAEQLAEATGLRHLSVNQVVKDKSCHEGWDDELKTWIVDEDKLLDEIEPQLDEGGNIIDWHVCEVFPERLIDLVVVLRVESQLLYDRLKARDYPEKKLQENLDSEIMQVILEEARESYNEQIVIELRSDNADEIDTNVERISQWVKNWERDHPEGV